MIFNDHKVGQDLDMILQESKWSLCNTVEGEELKMRLGDISQKKSEFRRMKHYKNKHLASLT